MRLENDRIFFCSLSCWLHGWSAWIPGCTTVAAISAAIETCVRKIYWWNFLLENIGNWRFWCWCLQCRWSSIYFDSVAHSMCFCLFSPLNHSWRGKKFFPVRGKRMRIQSLFCWCVECRWRSIRYFTSCMCLSSPRVKDERTLPILLVYRWQMKLHSKLFHLKKAIIEYHDKFCLQVKPILLKIESIKMYGFARRRFSTASEIHWQSPTASGWGSLMKTSPSQEHLTESTLAMHAALILLCPPS